SAVGPLEKLAARGTSPEARLTALCLLERLDALRSSHLLPALSDSHPGVRRQALRLAEGMVNDDGTLALAMLRLLDDPDPQVRLQVGCSLGAWSDGRSGRALATLLVGNADEPIMTAAVFSSLHSGNVGSVVSTLLQKEYAGKTPPALLERVFESAGAL